MQFLSGCNRKENVAEPVYDGNEMSEILTFLYLNEAKAINTYDLGIQKNEYVKTILYPALFDSLGIDSASFYYAYNYYQDRPEYLLEIMNEVVRRIGNFSVDTAAILNYDVLDERLKEMNETEQIRKQIDPVTGEGAF